MKKQHYSVYLKAFSLPLFLSVLVFIPKTFTLIDEIKKIVGTGFTVLLNTAAIIILISRLFQGFVSRYKADEEQIIYKRFFFRKKILNISIDKITAFCIIRSPLNRLTKSKTIIFKSGNISSYAKGIKITVSENEMNFQESAGFDGKKEKVNNLSLLLCALLRPATFLNLFVIWFPLLWAGLLFVFTATYNTNVLSISVITSTLAFSIGAFINILIFFNKYYGYTVIKKEDYLKASYGFISKYDYYLKSDKISAVVIYQNVFMRILGLRSIEMYVVGFFNAHNYLFHIGFLKLSTQQVCALFTVTFLTYLNSRGIKHGVITQNLFTVTKVLSIIGIILAGLFFGFNIHTLHLNAMIPEHFDFSYINIIFTAVVGAVFASITWNNITFIAGEIKNPSVNIPRALAYGTGLVILLYLLINTIYLGVLPIDLIQNAPEDIVGAQLMSHIFGAIGKDVMALIIMISAFGCANGMILAGSRVYYKMAKDRAFFRPLAVINRKTKVPVNSLWAQCGWISLLILWGNYTQLLDFVIYASLIFYLITTAGLFIYRKKCDMSRFKFRINNFFPVAFLACAGYVIVCLTIFKPMYTVPGLLITFAGIPVYSLWKKHKKKMINN